MRNRLLALLLAVMLIGVPLTPARAQDGYTVLGCWDWQMHDAADLDTVCLVRLGAEAPPPPVATTPVPTAIPPIAATATTVPAGPLARVVPDQFPTISAALVGITPGSTITVKAGTYAETVSVSVPGVTITADVIPATPAETKSWIDGGCARENGIQITANDVTVRGLGVRKSANQAVLIGDVGDHLPARVTIDKNLVVDYNCMNGGDAVNAGIAAYYTGSGLKITNNTIVRRVGITDQPLPGFGNGIWFKSSSNLPSGGGHTVSGNVIVGGWDGIGGEVEGDPHGTFDKTTVIEKNKISRCGDDGIQVEGGGQNVVVQDNEISECGTGVALATPLTGPVTVQRNKIVSSTIGTFGNLMCFKLGNTSTATMVITNNSCTIPPPAPGDTNPNRVGSGLQQTNSGSGVWQVSGNTFNVYGYVYNIAYNAPAAGSSFDGDCMYSTDPSGRFVKWANSVQLTFRDFQLGDPQKGRPPYERTGRLGPC